MGWVCGGEGAGRGRPPGEGDDGGWPPGEDGRAIALLVRMGIGCDWEGDGNQDGQEARMPIWVEWPSSPGGHLPCRPHQEGACSAPSRPRQETFELFFRNHLADTFLFSFREANG